MLLCVLVVGVLLVVVVVLVVGVGVVVLVVDVLVVVVARRCGCRSGFPGIIKTNLYVVSGSNPFILESGVVQPDMSVPLIWTRTSLLP